MKANIAVIVGSLRKDSISRKLAKALIGLQTDTLNLEIVEIGQLSFYNQDLEEKAPKEWVDFRTRIKSSDGVLFITPEYNRSIPAVLKNAIDVGSRPYGQSCWNGKPAGVISQSPGALGGFGASHHLQQSISCLGMPMLPGPEAYLSQTSEMFGNDGSVNKPETKEFLTKYIGNYAAWVAKFKF